MNNATNLAGSIVENMGVFLNTDHFAETVTIIPAGGSGPLSVVALVDRSSLQIHSVQHHRNAVEEVTILVAFDPVNSPTWPQTGTALLLPEDDPQTGVKWDFEERLQEDAASMLLKFKRTRVQRAGSSRPDQL